MSLSRSKKVVSIERKLTQYTKRRKLHVCSLANWGMLIAGLVIYALTMEYATVGELNGDNYRRLKFGNGVIEQLSEGCRDEIAKPHEEEVTEFGRRLRNFLIGTEYCVRNSDKLDELVIYRSAGDKLFELPLFIAMFFGLLGITGLYILQTLWCSLRSLEERRRISDMLQPIEEITAKADEMTRLEFDDTKYHNLEEKIAGLNPEESLPVTQGDKELESLENAINNLLMRMRESNRQQARFVNDASHELRTPIAVIEGYANMLARWGREDEKVLDESITAIQHESTHMKYLVEQLLFLARGDSGKTVLKLEDVSLSDMMREIYEESLMIDENHVYKFQYDEGVDVKRTCDPTLIKQAVRVLVDNAAKYTAEKNEITLSVGMTEDNRPYVQVSDTGIGMAESDVAHMFERFYRSDEVRSYRGTGLGLSIAKWIVDKHDGHFEVVSREGIGTKIRVVL